MINIELSQLPSHSIVQLYWNLEQSINTHKEHMKPSKIAEKTTHAEESTSTIHIRLSKLAILSFLI
jgi:hypothetical protein